MVLSMTVLSSGVLVVVQTHIPVSGVILRNERYLWVYVTPTFISEHLHVACIQPGYS
jgi:hypothetical protein